MREFRDISHLSLLKPSGPISFVVNVEIGRSQNERQARCAIVAIDICARVY